MAKIFVKFNTAVIREVELVKDETTFGRKEGNDIVIDNQAISGNHGKIVKEGDQYFIEDLNSTNGTYLNGHKIKKNLLKNKDQVSIARHILEFISDNSTVPDTEKNNTPISHHKEVDIKVPEKEIPKEPFINPEPVKKTSSPLEDPKPNSGESPQISSTAPATIKILAGNVNNQTEVKLKDSLTYIGTSEQALIKIKGLFAPSLAAVISKRPDGYFLKAVKAGYPKVNGIEISEQILLENGVQIEAGSTTMVFFSGAKKPSENKDS